MTNTKQTAHTPGPWNFGRTSLDVYAPETGKHIATAHLPLGWLSEERAIAEANARLIAAAPDLLAALEMIRNANVAMAEPIEDAMFAAIAKAQGGA